MKYDCNKIVYLIDNCKSSDHSLTNCINIILNKIGHVDLEQIVYKYDNKYYIYFDKLINTDLVEQYKINSTNNKLPCGCVELIFDFESIDVNLILDNDYFTNVISNYNSSSYTSVNMLVNDLIKLYKV